MCRTWIPESCLNLFVSIHTNVKEKIPIYRFGSVFVWLLSTNVVLVVRVGGLFILIRFLACFLCFLRSTLLEIHCFQVN